MSSVLKLQQRNQTQSQQDRHRDGRRMIQICTRGGRICSALVDITVRTDCVGRKRFAQRIHFMRISREPRVWIIATLYTPLFHDQVTFRNSYLLFLTSTVLCLQWRGIRELFWRSGVNKSYSVWILQAVFIGLCYWQVTGWIWTEAFSSLTSVHCWSTTRSSRERGALQEWRNWRDTSKHYSRVNLPKVHFRIGEDCYRCM